jgi:nitroreductase
MDTYTALATRRTAKAFAPDAPPREVLERIIEAATWAPNHRLTEPWRFTVIAGDERARFGDALAAWLRGPHGPEGIAEKAIESTRVKPLRSPILIVVAQQGRHDDPEMDLEDYAACCCATENLLLAAHAEGLAAKWSTGDMTIMPPALDYCGLAEGDRIVAYIYLGYPAEAEREPQRATRKPPAITWRGLDE